MGTRSLTRIIPRQEGVAYDKGHEMPEKSLINIYQQYDGYIEGVGLEYANFLKDIKIVNGLGRERDLGKVANGAHCLAAQLIAHLKTEAGYVYLYPLDTIDVGEEYIYTLYPKEGEPTYMSVYDVYTSEVIFVGTPDKLISKLDSQK